MPTTGDVVTRDGYDVPIPVAVASVDAMGLSGVAKFTYVMPMRLRGAAGFRLPIRFCGLLGMQSERKFRTHDFARYFSHYILIVFLQCTEPVIYFDGLAYVRMSET